jgi:hypothetical protein
LPVPILWECTTLENPDMSPQDDDTVPPPPSPYYSTWEPLTGPILGRDRSPALGVVASPDQPMPIGVAFPAGLVAHRSGPAVTFRIVFGKVEIEGQWLCVGREFNKLGEAAESL